MATLTSKLLQHQMVDVGTILRNPNHPAHVTLFKNGTMEPMTIDRRRGRPRLNWCNEVMKHVVKSSVFYEAAIVNKNDGAKPSLIIVQIILCKPLYCLSHAPPALAKYIRIVAFFSFNQNVTAQSQCVTQVGILVI